MTDLLGDQEPVMRVVQVAPRTTSSAVACAQINELQEGDMGDQERVTEIEERAEAAIEQTAELFDEGWCVCRSSSLPQEVLDVMREQLALNARLVERLRAAKAERDANLKYQQWIETDLATLRQQCSDNLREITARDAVLAAVRAMIPEGNPELIEHGYSIDAAEILSLLGSAPVSVLASHDAEVAAKALEVVAAKLGVNQSITEAEVREGLLAYAAANREGAEQ